VVDVALHAGLPSLQNDISVLPAPGRIAPAEPTFRDCLELRDRPFELHGDPVLTEKLFPDAILLYGRQTIDEIAALSYVVGMEVPGLNSLFSSLRIELTPLPNTPRLFSVVEGDERFNRLAINVTSFNIRAEIEAFYRPPTTHMPASADLVKHVRRGQYDGVCALVIGGSRGLGEITAKLIAAGGGAVIITYHTGENEANGIADDIRRSGGKCQVFPLTAGQATMLPSDMPPINQLYYFATPKIFGKRTTRFDEALYQEFFSVYVDGFKDIYRQLLERGNQPAILYPSTVAIDKPLPELAEYVKAKSDGEALCQRLNVCGQAAILIPRLPRTATDQTQALLHVPSKDPVDLMTPLISQMTELSERLCSLNSTENRNNAL
jgi:hypothetical protein